jgi:uncharacterized membrane protein
MNALIVKAFGAFNTLLALAFIRGGALSGLVLAKSNPQLMKPLRNVGGACDSTVAVGILFCGAVDLLVAILIYGYFATLVSIDVSLSVTCIGNRDSRDAF